MDATALTKTATSRELAKFVKAVKDGTIFAHVDCKWGGGVREGKETPRDSGISILCYSTEASGGELIVDSSALHNGGT